MSAEQTTLQSIMCTKLNQGNVAEVNRAFYSAFYELEDNDSPDNSRLSLITRLHTYVSFLPQKAIVLDLGSGKQILEKEYSHYLKKKKLSPNCQIITVDIAKIQRNQLLSKQPWHQHIRADGEKLPFTDSSFDIVVSNMALDFMNKTAIKEVVRVAKKGSPAFFNFHHPALIPTNLDEMIAECRRKISKKVGYGGKISTNKELTLKSLLHHRYLKDNSVLFQNTDQIKNSLTSYGFFVVSVCEGVSPGDRWWEADVYKIA